MKYEGVGVKKSSCNLYLKSSNIIWRWSQPFILLSRLSSLHRCKDVLLCAILMCACCSGQAFPHVHLPSHFHLLSAARRASHFPQHKRSRLNTEAHNGSRHGSITLQRVGLLSNRRAYAP
jgi:hypothetical protein